MKKRTSFGVQSIDQNLSKLLKPLFSGNKKEFIMINNLVKNWSEIVGKKYAEFCYPKSVNLGKFKESGGKLTIAVYNPAVGFFLDNNAEVIIERIAAFYGFKSIAKIIIRQEPKMIAKKPKEIRLSDEKEEGLTRITSGIENEGLAETLRKLGRDVLKD